LTPGHPAWYVHKNTACAFRKVFPNNKFADWVLKTVNLLKESLKASFVFTFRIADCVDTTFNIEIGPDETQATQVLSIFQLSLWPSGTNLDFICLQKKLADAST
jgi:hypothetical protein